jgi:hypothetical protein
VRRFGIFDHLDDGGSPQPAPNRRRSDPTCVWARTVLRRRVVDRGTRYTATQACKRGAVSPYRLSAVTPALSETALEIIEDRVAVALAGSFAAEPAIEQRPDADREDDTRPPAFAPTGGTGQVRQSAMT